MKLISNHELQQRSESELSILFRKVSEGPPRAVPFQGDGGAGALDQEHRLGLRPMLPLFA